MLERGGGSIVNNASVDGITVSNDVPYSTMKHAVVGLTKSASHQYANDGIRVNAVCPGWIETDMTEGLDANKDLLSFYMAGASIKRLGRPEEIASAVVWLCSEGASYTTAAALPVSGGYLG